MRSSRQARLVWQPAIENVAAEMERRTDSAPHLAWRSLYMAALFETDEGLASQRIAEAKMALARRAHDLFHSAGDHLKERSAIEATLQSLHALERCRATLARPMVVRTRLEEAIASVEAACAD